MAKTIPPKTILFFADGTWNDSDPNDGDDRVTNVYRLFEAIDGELSGKPEDDLQHKLKKDSNDNITQTALYIWGIGAHENPLKIFGFNTGLDPDQLVEGAFGKGFEERLLKGFAFIASVYAPGDSIILIGFSRGAYIARTLAEVICYMGLPKSTDSRIVDTCKEAWDYYSDQMFMRHKLPDPGKSGLDLLKDISVKAVCVFDSVGDLGLGKYQYQYTSEVVHPKIENAFHAVALDEQRKLFTPTLWLPSPALSQLAFAGAHADVGGGYKDGAHSYSSNIPYCWMRDNMISVGVSFINPKDKPTITTTAPFSVIHRPWTDIKYKLTGAVPRTFKRKYGMDSHSSVKDRIDQDAYTEDDDSELNPKKWSKPTPYKPAGRLNA